MRTAVGKVLVLILAGVVCGCTSTPEDATPAANATPAATAPAEFGALTVTPATGQARDQVFTVHLQRAPGSPVPFLVGLLINAGASGNGACYIFNAPGTARILLVNDSGSGSQEAAAAPSVGNTQCDVLADQPVSTVTNDAVSVSFHVRFKPGFKGAKLLYAIAQDANGGGTGLRAAGQFKIE
jgi:hypothetical protein